MSEDIKKLNSIVSRLKQLKLEGDMMVNCYFSYEDQELVRRILKSVFKSIKNTKDREVALSILERTSWMDDI